MAHNQNFSSSNLGSDPVPKRAVKDMPHTSGTSCQLFTSNPNPYQVKVVSTLKKDMTQ